jgi:hypothetical protein
MGLCWAEAAEVQFLLEESHRSNTEIRVCGQPRVRAEGQQHS